jgi:hypothetical protein
VTKEECAIYTLTSAAIPQLSNSNKDLIQAEIVYKCLQPFGESYTLEQLISAAKKLKLEATFRSETSTTVRQSLLYHLNRFKHSGIVRVIENAKPQDLNMR